MPEAGGEKVSRLRRALGLDTPLFSARHQHGGVVCLQFGFGSFFNAATAMDALFRRITLAVHFKREPSLEQIWNAT